MHRRDLSGVPAILQAWWIRAQNDGIPLLVVAAAIVGFAIGLDGDIRKVLNGIAVIVWLIAAWFIVRSAFAAGVTLAQVGICAVVILILSTLIRPSDPLLALIGFGWGGVAVGWIGRSLGSKLGALLGALWLPAHLIVAVSQAGIRELRDQPAAIRTDPPPTAIIVPLVMVLAAWFFAAWMSDWREKRETATGSSRPDLSR